MYSFRQSKGKPSTKGIAIEYTFRENFLEQCVVHMGLYSPEAVFSCKENAVQNTYIVVELLISRGFLTTMVFWTSFEIF